MNGPKTGSLYKNRRIRETALDTASFAGLILIALAVVFPIWWIFRSSLMNNAELYAWPPTLFPKKWLFSNYATALKSFPFWRYFTNTMIVIAPSVIAGTSTATLCGYAFARLRFPGKKLFFSLCVGSMLLPTMVTLIPLYVMWTRGLHLVDSYLPLILPFFCGGGAFNIFLIRQFVRTIPKELDEAAFIDGAGHWVILTRIIVPAIKPAMVVVALLLFIQLWNDLLQQTVYINSTEKFTIAIGLTQFNGSLYSDWAMIMCATCMSFLPGVVFYLIGQKQFVEGIVLTGMKN
jgi:multiple sugar transport system permease protein